MRKFGFHLSVAGSFSNAPLEAKRKGYGAFQMFVASTRTWRSAQPNQFEIDQFHSALNASGAEPFVHLPYLCNPSSPEPEIITKSIQMLRDNIAACASLNIKYLVIHIGSHKGTGIDAGIRRATDTMSKVLGFSPKVTILLENGAGYGNSVGSKFDEIGKIIDGLGSDNVGLCFDTCHTFAAGYDLVSEEGIENVVSEIDSQIGLDKMHLVHLNDSKYERGSGLDRHWHIGKGYIGVEGFTNFFRNRNFSSGNFVMETPVDMVADNDSDMSELAKILKSAKSGE
jgi:deoxyribonuclease-4